MTRLYKTPTGYDAIFVKYGDIFLRLSIGICLNFINLKAICLDPRCPIELHCHHNFQSMYSIIETLEYTSFGLWWTVLECIVFRDSAALMLGFGSLALVHDDYHRVLTFDLKARYHTYLVYSHVLDGQKDDNPETVNFLSLGKQG